MRQLAPTLSALFLAAACGGRSAANGDDGHDDAGTIAPPTTPSAGQHILFESSYVNFAWSSSIKGTYITNAGELYQYDYVNSAPLDAGAPFLDFVARMTEEQVTQKFGPSPTLVGTLDYPALLEHYAQLGNARLGTLLGQRTCADAGDLRYVGYLYDSPTGLYTPVMLGTDGDDAVRNTSPQAEALIQWLVSLADQQGERFCTYRANECYGELCPGTEPCPADKAPMRASDTGCMQDCGVVTRCQSVPDCSKCAAANAACVIDGQDAVHCVSWLHGCKADITCDCGGDDLCAGGASFCHGDGASGLRCSPP